MTRSLLAVLALVGIDTVRAEETDLPDYVGAGSCASSSCHGSKKPRDVFAIRQNEYTIWAGRDDVHSRAYDVLGNPTSRLIQRNLGQQIPASESKRCLACHAVDVPQPRRGKSFRVADGVSCEACHGPAERWLGPHTIRGWTRGQSIKLGMRDNRDLVVRVNACLDCHLGDETRQVDHTLLAAGHPDLIFELDTFSAVMPAHWRPDDDGTWTGAREWAVGQVVALSRWIKLLSRRQPTSGWPEFADLECFACHHGLVATDDSYRVHRGYDGVAGRPELNASRYLMPRLILRWLDPSLADRLDAEWERLRHAANGGTATAELARAARSIVDLMQPVAPRLADFTTALDSTFAESIVGAAAAESERIAASGYRSAEQVALALDALSRPYLAALPDGERDRLRRAIDELFATMEDPNRFDPQAFETRLRALPEVFSAR